MHERSSPVRRNGRTYCEAREVTHGETEKAYKRMVPCWQDWLVVKDLPNSMIVRHRYTSEVRVIEKAAR